jgi:surface polysaccharide O-acyltransferase-like enzyme
MEQKRVFYYDLLKTIAIFLVCLYHFGTLNINFNENLNFLFYFNYFIYSLSSIGVPVFFMVNGALLFNKEFAIKKHLNKTLTVFVLTIVWGVLTLLFTCWAYNDHYSAREFVEALVYLKQGRNNHLWYLKAIIYIYLLFPLIKALFDKKDNALNLFLMVMLFFFTFGQNMIINSIDFVSYISGTDLKAFKQFTAIAFSWLNPFGIYLSFSLLYFFLGGLLPELLKNKYFNTSISLTAFVFSWILLFVSGIIKTKSSGIVYDTVWNGYNTLSTLIMTVCVFVLCSKFESTGGKFRNIVQVIGVNSLGIYLIHVLIGSWLTKFYTKLPFSDYLLTDLVYALVILLLSLGMTMIIKKIPVVKRLVSL